MIKWFFLLTALCFLCTAQSSHAQLRIAALGGPHSASVLQDHPGITEPNINRQYNARAGMHLGVLTEIPLSRSSSSGFFLHPGIQYMAKGRKYQMFNRSDDPLLNDTISSSQNFSVNYIEIPVHLSYKFPLGKKTNFLVGAGPYLGLLYNGKQTNETRLNSETG